METLVEVAKRLGIKPNPNMTFKEFEEIRSKIRAALKLGSSPHLGYSMYNKRRSVVQGWDRKAVSQNIAVLKNMHPKGISVHNQDGKKVSLDDDDVFVWHSARPKGKDYVERFAVSIKLDDPKLPLLYEKLDDFIKKYQAGFKITDVGHADRTDTLNVYMSQSITPEIAKEFYEVVGPFLKKENHEYLDGFTVRNHGHEIQGIKYGPEPNVWGHLRKAGGRSLCGSISERVRMRLKELPPVLCKNLDFYDFKDAGSLGTVSANVRYLNLLYYLAGKEGQNPFQLGNQYGLPLDAGFSPKIARRYVDKKMDIADVGRTSVKTSVVAPVPSVSKQTHSHASVKKPTPEFVPSLIAPVSHSVRRVLPSKPVSVATPGSVPRISHPLLKSAHTSMKDLLQELRSLTAEIQAARSELTQLRRENSQIRGKLSEILRENVQLWAQNEFLRAQVMSAFLSVVVKTAKNHGKS